MWDNLEKFKNGFLNTVNNENVFFSGRAGKTLPYC